MLRESQVWAGPDRRGNNLIQHLLASFVLLIPWLCPYPLTMKAPGVCTEFEESGEHRGTWTLILRRAGYKKHTTKGTL